MLFWYKKSTKTTVVGLKGKPLTFSSKKTQNTGVTESLYYVSLGHLLRCPSKPAWKQGPDTGTPRWNAAVTDTMCTCVWWVKMSSMRKPVELPVLLTFHMLPSIMVRDCFVSRLFFKSFLAICMFEWSRRRYLKTTEGMIISFNSYVHCQEMFSPKEIGILPYLIRIPAC